MLSRYLYSKLHLLANTASCPAYRCERYQTSVTHVNAYSTRQCIANTIARGNLHLLLVPRTEYSVRCFEASREQQNAAAERRHPGSASRAMIRRDK